MCYTGVLPIRVIVEYKVLFTLHTEVAQTVTQINFGFFPHWSVNEPNKIFFKSDLG